MSDYPKFDIGEVVRLKSGGPKMTVMRHNDNNSTVCDWFNHKGNNKSASFAVGTLEHAGDEINHHDERFISDGSSPHSA